jgi:hypothetical protein
MSVFNHLIPADVDRHFAEGGDLTRKTKDGTVIQITKPMGGRGKYQLKKDGVEHWGQLAGILSAIVNANFLAEQHGGWESE